MELCLECNKKLSFGPYELKVGMHKIIINTKFCKNCGSYSLTPKNQKEIENWATKFKGKFAQISPYVSEEAYSLVSNYAEKFNCTTAEFIRACTSFYLNIAVNQDSFELVKKSISLEICNLNRGEKIKNKIDVRYSLFRKIQMYKKIYKLNYDNNVVEHALYFCLAVLNNNDNKIQNGFKKQANCSIAEIIDAA